MLAGELIDTPTPINIASGQEMYISWLVEKIKELMGYQGETHFDRSKPDGQKRRCWKIGRAKELLGWTPTVGIDEGLRRTVEWYRSQLP
jgi:nucleoside-diphosphate-sugar epimerase